MRCIEAFMQLITGNLATLFLLELSELRKQFLLQSLHLVLVSLHALNVCLEKVFGFGILSLLLHLVHQRAHHLRVFRLFRLVRVDSLRWWWGLVLGGVAGELHNILEDEFVRGGGGVFVLLERFKKLVDARKQAVVDNALILQGLNLVAALLSLLVDLSLLGSDERTLVDIGMNFDVRVIGQL